MTNETNNETDELRSGLKLWADVGLEVGKAADKMAAKTDELKKALQDKTPIFFTYVASGYFTTGTPLYLNLGGPDVGTFWEVRAWATGGVDYHTTAAGKAGLYITPLGSDAGSGTGNVADFTSSLSYSNRYSSDQIIVKPNEYVISSINGGTNGQQYVANIRVVVWRDDAAGGASSYVV